MACNWIYSKGVYRPALLGSWFSEIPLGVGYASRRAAAHSPEDFFTPGGSDALPLMWPNASNCQCVRFKDSSHALPNTANKPSHLITTPVDNNNPNAPQNPPSASSVRSVAVIPVGAPR